MLECVAFLPSRGEDTDFADVMVREDVVVGII